VWNEKTQTGKAVIIDWTGPKFAAGSNSYEEYIKLYKGESSSNLISAPIMTIEAEKLITKDDLNTILSGGSADGSENSLNFIMGLPDRSLSDLIPGEPTTPEVPDSETNSGGSGSTSNSFQNRVEMTVPAVQTQQANAQQTQTEQTTTQQQSDDSGQSTSQQSVSSQQSSTTGQDTGAGQSTSTGATQQSTGQTGAGQQTTPGANAHEISTVDQSASAQSGMPIWALGGVILLIILIAAGYFRSDILGFLRK